MNSEEGAVSRGRGGEGVRREGAEVMVRLVFVSMLVVLVFGAGLSFGEGTVTVAVYNQDLALIKEVRDLKVPVGVSTLEFRDVAETIDPTTLQVRSLSSPDGFRILDQNYEYDLINAQNLLNKYVGKRLKVVIPDAKGPEGAKSIREATLLANNDRPIFRLDEVREGQAGENGEIYVGSYDAVLLPAIPEGLRAQPTLVWLVDNREREDQQIEVSYLASGMNWKADYVLKIDRNNAKGSLSGWVTLDNQAGKAFKEAKLKLVAGDVHRVSRPEARPDLKLRTMMAAAPAEEAMQQEEFFEYHLYSLGRAVDLANRQTKQITLLQVPEVTIEKRLVGQWNSRRYEVGQRSVQKQKLGVYLKFKNSPENGLGIPLPKGIVRAYQESEDGTVIFIGEDSIDHTGKNNDVEIKTGESFDVIVERKQIDYRKTGTNSARYTWELKVKNSKDVPQRVELEETIPGDWKMVQSNTKYEKLDAHRIKFTVDAPPSKDDKSAVIVYEVEVSW